MKKTKRDLFSELMSGVNDMFKYRQKKITLKVHKQEAEKRINRSSRKIKVDFAR